MSKKHNRIMSLINYTVVIGTGVIKEGLFSVLLPK